MSDYKETLAFVCLIVLTVVLVEPESVGKFWNKMVAGFSQQVTE